MSTLIFKVLTILVILLVEVIVLQFAIIVFIVQLIVYHLIHLTIILIDHINPIGRFTFTNMCQLHYFIALRLFVFIIILTFLILLILLVIPILFKALFASLSLILMVDIIIKTPTSIDFRFIILPFIFPILLIIYLPNLDNHSLIISLKLLEYYLL